MNLLQVGLRTKQVLGEIKTVCKKCDCTETSKFYGGNEKLLAGSFTKRCGCGTFIYKFHLPDANNETSYFTKAFIPIQVFDKDYSKKDSLERVGFKKINGKYVK